ncbi:hypothetical protein MF428_004981 [Salmonella enterica]|nr:hypothetical protein [Salmonella enterica]
MSVTALMVAVETLKAYSSSGSRLHARREHADNLLFYPASDNSQSVFILIEALSVLRQSRMVRE